VSARDGLENIHRSEFGNTKHIVSNKDFVIVPGPPGNRHRPAGCAWAETLARVETYLLTDPLRAERGTIKRRAMMTRTITATLMVMVALSPAAATEDYASWPVLESTFPSTGGGGITIKGYDPVITGGKCLTTFMAVEPGDNPKVYPNVIEFEAVPVSGGTLCTNGKWRAFDGGATGTTPFRMVFRDGVFRRSP
jgi:hypothetical protein